MYCEKCGAVMKNDSESCEVCGAPADTDLKAMESSEIIGKTYIFTRTIYGYIGVNTQVEFEQTALIIGNVIPKRVNYGDILDITIDEKVNPGKLIMMISFLLFGLLSLIAGEFLYGIILIVLGCLDILWIKNLVVTLRTKKGNAYKIKMSKNDSDKENFLKDLRTVIQSQRG